MESGMRKWLRTKLRKWLGIEATDDQQYRISLTIGMSPQLQLLNPSSIIGRIESLNTAIVNQGKSFQKQIQEVCDIDGNQPAAPHIPDSHWQKTKLGGAINELRANHAALLHHIGPPYLPEPRGVRTVYMELEHLRNRVKAMEPANAMLGSLDGTHLTTTIVTVPKKKPRIKSKKWR